jgi:pimeloyl-ACP methyl ester carboxylesterase
MASHRSLLLLTGFAVLTLLGGCTLARLDGQARTFYQSTVLAGRVEAPGCPGPVVVAAYDKQRPGSASVERAWLHEAGGFELIVGRGEYGLLGFCDTNRNGSYDAGEPAAEYEGPAPIVAADSGTVVMLDFAITAHSGLHPALARSVMAWPALAGRHSKQAGAMADLSAPIFSARNGQRGYWEPVSFFRESGGNLYFTEPYDPQRTPVVFVHGAGGSAQEWRPMLEHLDRSRYQAWIYQYPSGAAVESMAYLLYWKLYNLQLKHRFERVDFVAHSMGGLVVRTFLLNHSHQMAPVKSTFISLSTPWGGDPLASVGVKHSPAVVPSWRDMQPEGAFMAHLFDRPLAPAVQHYLLFGYHGGPGVLRSANNDGTVLLSSQLRAGAQAQARMVYGFDDDHAGILASPQARAQVFAILDNASRPDDASAQAGRLRLSFSVDGPGASDAPPQAPWLLLLPRGEPQGAMIQIPLKPDDDGRSLGPLPPGDYDVTLASPGFRSEPRLARLTVGAGATQDIAFRLVPQGELSGYVAADPTEFSRPAGIYEPPHAKLRINAMTLEGAGASRVLTRHGEQLRDLAGCYVDGQDRMAQAGFCFVGLPQGDYRLTIDAEGYRPFVMQQRVMPGKPSLLKPIVLEPLRPAR